MARGSRPRREDHAAIRRLADELLPALMARLEASPLGELEVRQDGWRVRLRKPVGGTPAGAPAGRRGQGKARPAASDGANPAPGPRPKGSEGGEPVRRAITSPAVGTFHPAEGMPVGHVVRGGDVVGHVEVLGVPQEVVAPLDGVLGRRLVEPGQVVEYGEPLMRIETGAPERS